MILMESFFRLNHLKVKWYILQSSKWHFLSKDWSFLRLGQGGIFARNVWSFKLRSCVFGLSSVGKCYWWLVENIQDMFFFFPWKNIGRFLLKSAKHMDLWSQRIFAVGHGPPWSVIKSSHLFPKRDSCVLSPPGAGYPPCWKSFEEHVRETWYQGLRWWFLSVCLGMEQWNPGFPWHFFFLGGVEVLFPSGSGGTGVQWSSGELRICAMRFGNCKTPQVMANLEWYSIYI